jgi:PAS domain-containing protein
MINAKIAKEQMQEIASMVDMRFGPGTWRGIVDERAKRIQEAKEAEAARRRAEKLRQQEMIENAKIGIAIFALVTVVVGLFIAAIALSG